MDVMEDFDIIFDKVETQKQRVRDQYPLPLSNRDWDEIDTEYNHLSRIEAILRTVQLMYARFKEGFSTLDREVIGVYETVVARERLQGEQTYYFADRMRVS